MKMKLLLAFHAVPLLFVFLLIILSNSAPLHGQRNISIANISRHPFKIHLQHRDFSSSTSTAETLIEKMKLAVDRSKRRLQFFQTSIQSKLSAARISSSADAVKYESSVASSDGAYITSITLGTPGVTFPAIVDTGSDLVWRQCQPCDSCYRERDGIFDPAKSSTYEKASCEDSLCQALPQWRCASHSTCQYFYQYGDMSSTMGDFGYDTLALGGVAGTKHYIPHFGFGCGHDNEGSSFAGAGGLLGLGGGSLSLVSQLSLPKFSYCLVSVADSTSKTSPLIFGDSIAINDAKATPIISNPSIDTFYYVKLNAISVGGKLVDVPSGTFAMKPDGSGGIVMDSGTTITFLEDEGYQAVLSAFQSAINLPKADGSLVGLDLCYQKSGEVPSLTFHFEGADLDLPTDNYFLDFDGLYCLAMGSSSGFSILGNIQQQNLNILYDVTAKILSFAPVACNTL